jgi:ABC-type multidrug transport system fused ATPase/permease subunit
MPVSNIPNWPLWGLHFLLIFVCCGLLPWLALHFLMKVLAETPSALVKNYAGRLVPLGLGIIWPLWVCGWLVFHVFFGDLHLVIREPANLRAIMPALLTLVGYAVAVLATFGFGLIDDAFGTKDTKGFKGHLRALRHARLTTGSLKLFGVGIAALFLAFCLRPYRGGSTLEFWLWIVTVGVAGVGTALCANFFNLCDLRPGRAGKVYGFILVIGLIFSLIQTWASGLLSATTVLSELSQALAFLLPMLLCLRYDMSEQGMLGDAGANPAGLIAGAWLTSQLGLVGALIFLVIMLSLNLVSEKVSFSRVIEKNSLLASLDQIGRIKK